VIARHVTIRGLVQGVGFRWSRQREAARLGLAGWVRNRADGSVEARVQGEADAVDRLLGWCERGPPGSQVEAVESTPAEPDHGLSGFAIERSG
jgi:acylphosphatase